ncbi:histidine phosphatase superfamily [Cladochytrium replicatum]|nr:histidine phosphatase superfamily [Cladochytrium replicatum]
MAQYDSILYLVRHGERIDSVDRSWYKSAQEPLDPPLTSTGIKQTSLSGHLIASSNLADGPLPQNPINIRAAFGSGLTKTNTSAPLKLPITQVFSSPFLRCIQTANEIHKALLEYPELVRAAALAVPTETSGITTSANLAAANTQISAAAPTNDLVSASRSLLKRSNLNLTALKTPLASSIPNAITTQSTVPYAPPTPRPAPITFTLDNGLCEWMSPSYFPHPYQPPQPDTTAFPSLVPRPVTSARMDPAFMWPRYPESTNAMYSRMAATVTRIVELYGRNAAVVCVTHGAGVAAAVERLVAPDEVIVNECPYASVTKLVRRKGELKWSVEMLMYNEHIPEALRGGGR